LIGYLLSTYTKQFIKYLVASSIVFKIHPNMNLSHWGLDTTQGTLSFLYNFYFTSNWYESRSNCIYDNTHSSWHTDAALRSVKNAPSTYYFSVVADTSNNVHAYLRRGYATALALMLPMYILQEGLFEVDNGLVSENERDLWRYEPFFF
jgi:hypothetical protein